MEKMEHFRDAKLMEGEKVLLNGVEGYLGFHAKPGGRKQWYGYFELTDEQHIQAGVDLKLILADGRMAEVNASDIEGSGQPGKSRHAAEFYVVGEFRKERRGLGDDIPQYRRLA